jgi:hypothetical protein
MLLFIMQYFEIVDFIVFSIILKSSHKKIILRLLRAVRLRCYTVLV